MSLINVDNIKNRVGGAFNAPSGINVTGVVTATTFSGNLTGDVTGNVIGDVTGNVTGDATGLTGTPNIVVGSVQGTTGSFSGSVSIGGTLTYEDVANVDSVGVVTARSGIKVGAGQSISSVSGTIYYYGDGSNLSGVSAGLASSTITLQTWLFGGG